MENKDLPKIYKLGELENVPFQIIEVGESILQGWDASANRMKMLFKTKNDKWGFWDAANKKVVDDIQWDDHKALLDGQWINMNMYFKVHIRFEAPIAYTKFFQGNQTQEVTTEASVLVGKKALDSLQSQMNGRAPNSFYQFTYEQGKKNKYVVGGLWVK